MPVPVRRLTHYLAVFSLFFVAYCTQSPTVTPESVQLEAEAHFNEAIALLNNGEIQASWQSMHKMEGAIDGYFHVGPMGESTRGDRQAAKAMGRSLDEWREEWRKRYALNVRSSWPLIRQAIEEESIDLPVLKGFASEFVGREYVTRINEEYRRLKPVFLLRRAQQYWFSCNDLQEICKMFREALEARMPPKSLTTAWTGNREDYKGVFELEIQVVREATYTLRNQSKGTLPETVVIILNAQARRGDTPWDGRRSFEIQAELPQMIRENEYDGVAKAHWQNLRENLERQVAEWYQQG